MADEAVGSGSDKLRGGFRLGTDVEIAQAIMHQDVDAECNAADQANPKNQSESLCANRPDDQGY